MNLDRPAASRRRLNVVQEAMAPAYVVWELTLRCDHACGHCGSRASVARPQELTVPEALDVVGQLQRMGAREVVLIGGEAYLHPGFLQVVAALRSVDITPVITTGGRGVDAALAQAMASAGLARASVSMDGLADSHDRQRRQRGSFARALAALGHLQNAGIATGANTTLSRDNQADLEDLFEVVRSAGVRSWQVQLMAPLGRAADHPQWLLQPWQLLDLLPRIASLKERARAAGVLLMPGNNLGYFGPEEGLLRSPSAAGQDHFRGCQAGRFIMGIESHGAIKGCPSLQSSVYVGGNVKTTSLQQIWDDSPQLSFARHRTVADLWGFCRSCPFAATCLGGCSFTAHALMGRPGNNPYCHYRARAHAARGLRERLVRRQPAPGQPFDSASFTLQLEPDEASVGAQAEA